MGEKPPLAPLPPLDVASPLPRAEVTQRQHAHVFDRVQRRRSASSGPRLSGSHDANELAPDVLLSPPQWHGGASGQKSDAPNMQIAIGVSPQRLPRGGRRERRAPSTGDVAPPRPPRYEEMLSAGAQGPTGGLLPPAPQHQREHAASTGRKRCTASPHPRPSSLAATEVAQQEVAELKLFLLGASLNVDVDHYKALLCSVMFLQDPLHPDRAPPLVRAQNESSMTATSNKVAQASCFRTAAIPRGSEPTWNSCFDLVIVKRYVRVFVQILGQVSRDELRNVPQGASGDGEEDDGGATCDVKDVREMPAEGTGKEKGGHVSEHTSDATREGEYGGDEEDVICEGSMTLMVSAGSISILGGSLEMTSGTGHIAKAGVNHTCNLFVACDGELMGTVNLVLMQSASKKPSKHSIMRGQRDKKMELRELVMSGLTPCEIDEDTVSQLLKWAGSKGGDLGMRAAALLSALAYPVERYIGLRSRLQSAAIYQRLMTMARNGAIELHQPISPDEVEIGAELSKGAGGVVYRGTWNDMSVAVKKCDEYSMGITVPEFRFEIAVMTLVNHPNVLSCCGAHVTKESLLMVTPFCSHGSLEDLLVNTSVDLPIVTRLQICSRIADALGFLHSLQIIHRDMKTANVLIDKTLSDVKVTDFGTSRVFSRRARHMTHNVGTTPWMAPEVFATTEKYTEKADVYSFAVVMWSVVTREHPFCGAKNFMIPEMVTAGIRPPIPVECPAVWRDLIAQCWEQDPKKRPLFPAISQTLLRMLTAAQRGTI